jgi:hypothetical protein
MSGDCRGRALRQARTIGSAARLGCRQQTSEVAKRRASRPFPKLSGPWNKKHAEAVRASSRARTARARSWPKTSAKIKTGPRLDRREQIGEQIRDTSGDLVGAALRGHDAEAERLGLGERQVPSRTRRWKAKRLALETASVASMRTLDSPSRALEPELRVEVEKDRSMRTPVERRCLVQQPDELEVDSPRMALVGQSGVDVAVAQNVASRMRGSARRAHAGAAPGRPRRGELRHRLDPCDLAAQEQAAKPPAEGRSARSRGDDGRLPALSSRSASADLRRLARAFDPLERDEAPLAARRREQVRIDLRGGGERGLERLAG